MQRGERIATKKGLGAMLFRQVNAMQTAPSCSAAFLELMWSLHDLCIRHRSFLDFGFHACSCPDSADGSKSLGVVVCMICGKRMDLDPAAHLACKETA